jgi:hypothetical protein
VRNRTFLPQLVPDRKRVLDPARVQMIEIGGPIGDGRAAAHEAALSVFAGSLARNPLDFIAGSDGTAIKGRPTSHPRSPAVWAVRLQTEDLGYPPKFAENRAPGHGTWFDTYPGRGAKSQFLPNWACFRPQACAAMAVVSANRSNGCRKSATNSLSVERIHASRRARRCVGYAESASLFLL